MTHLFPGLFTTSHPSPLQSLVACVVLIGLMSPPAQAQLVQRAGGQFVYDMDRDLTWMADANYVKTAGYHVSGATNLFVTNQIMAQLNLDMIGGVSDWQLPAADPACSTTFGCTTSDMGHLFYDVLGGTSGISILASGDPDLTLFSNFQSGLYWTRDFVVGNPGRQWNFAFVLGGSSGRQNTSPNSLNNWILPVREGDIGLVPATYCTPGTSSNGCTATMSATGTASATAASGFTLTASTVEGQNNGIFFFGTNGRQANAWGNGTSFQCVVPPVKRAGLLTGTGTNGLCDGSLVQDLNALWCPACPKPGHNPGAGALVQAQLWYRDPQNTSNQTTSLSDAIEFALAP